MRTTLLEKVDTERFRQRAAASAVGDERGALTDAIGAGGVPTKMDSTLSSSPPPFLVGGRAIEAQQALTTLQLGLDVDGSRPGAHYENAQVLVPESAHEV